MSVFTLYTNPMSRGNSVVWMLEECGAHYELINLEFGDAMHTEDYLRINPMGKVPALVHKTEDGDVVLTEAVAINTYLAEQFPEKALIPEVGTPERGQFYRLLILSQQFESAMLDQLHGIESTPARAKSIGYGTFEQSMATLSTLIDGKSHLIGDRFGVIDVIYAALLAWGVNLIKVLPASAPVQAYLGNISQRSGFKSMLSKTTTS